ncbi:SusC/RagA family TonB-linked outer membrane protein [Zunongwangia pacifica]|uniref:SusC/RagA family TonB-linked outer membrane protein n=1 Tax=Zunongwangia pacifica TaxID=2911062 RepID=A0A9X1ZXQ5_9FLAO|nr:SusC/RagA family TonB-linked outer membrane protein [Zunongwangia pacifica]MCL6218336.1 SusC/RagA family TonB-linked outer membrane protein [Zunongwangia pacifica]
MKVKLCSILTLLLVLVAQISFAQEKTVTGNVTDGDGIPLPGVTVLVKDTNNGTQTDFDGNYSIQVSTGDVLEFSFIGLQTVRYTVENNNTIDVVMEPDESQLEEVVVTALGISREKKSLAYATQEVSGDQVNTAKEANFINSLSGKVAGLDVKKSSSLGGSSNIILRGYTSLTGNNQPLFVVDGVPISNQNTNASGQASGGGGYDYGNAAMDINPDDVASINVLKGAAASALYGSRAANGAIIITTKTGKRNKGIGVTINSGVTFSNYDKSTFTKYQKEYGSGYGAYYGETGYFDDADIDGDGTPDLVVPTYEDASFGGRFDPNLLVYQWDAFYPESENYLQATPWTASKNDPGSIFRTGAAINNSVSVSGGTEKSSFRTSFTQFEQEGILPNSKIKRKTVDFNGKHDLTDRLTVGINGTYTKTNGKGRYGTGYDSRNILQSMRQWNQNNVDFKQQKEAYFSTGRNVTWNMADPINGNVKPKYTDNPYWTLYENYETDVRDRFFGNANINYEVADWFNITARASMDNYTDLREERINVGSNGVSEYSRYDGHYREMNYDLLLNFNHDLTEDIDFTGILGATRRSVKERRLRSKTEGGLVVPGEYALRNSVNLLVPPSEYAYELIADGYFANVSFGFRDFLFLEATGRIDRSSTLPEDDNTYFYPSINGGFVFSELFDSNFINFGKLRANYAEVGNYAPPLAVYDVYDSPVSFSSPLRSVQRVKNNPNLKSETQKSYEIGLEMNFFNKRAGFDIAAYKTNTVDQIVNSTISGATGYTSQYINAGEIENKGLEVSAFVSPIKTEDFEWRLDVNWFTNENTVKSLNGDNQNLVLASLQGGITINGTVGESYGSIWGTNYTYLNGEKLINAENGRYVVDNTPQPIGDINPDWKGGINNTLKYKNLALSFLVDIQQGGDVFSLDTWYGYATGVTENTAGLNELGNPVRDPVSEGGGILLSGVNQDGSPNETRASMTSYANALGYYYAPNAAHVYDASYVKLREVTLSYSLPKDWIENVSLTGVTFSAVGRNLWIIHKNTPYADPEAGLSSGNVQGYQSGAYPSVREYGLNVRLQF